MERPKIAIIGANGDGGGSEAILRILADTALPELCTPVFCDTGNVPEEAAEAAATVYASTTLPAECPAGATELIATDELLLMPLAGEPTAEDIVRLRDILERDFDLRAPRIAVLREGSLQNPGLANEVTTGKGINTYGPYTTEQLLQEGMARHFDAIVCAGTEPTVQHTVEALSLKAPVRCFAGTESVVTAIFQTVPADEEDGLADISALTHPIYTALDIIRNRTAFDEARQDPLQRLYHDKREDRKRDNGQRNGYNNNNTEKE